ncbi:MAG: OmpA family protein [Nonlabens sp.]
MKLYIIPFLYLLTTFHSSAQDKEGSSDHPLVPRFKQARIYDYEVKSFEPLTIATSKVTKYDELDEKLKVEGKKYLIWYDLPSSMGSTYEIYTNFKNAYSGNNAEVLFTCNGKKECGKYFWNAIGSDNSYLMSSYLGEEIAYHAAQFQKDGKQYTIAITVGYGLGEQGYEVHIIENEIMEQTMDVDGITASINENGKMAFNGILFETGSDRLKSSSYKEIALIADYLTNNPKSNIYVVGHTDSIGSYETNLSLSERRAISVVNALKTKHKVKASRLMPVGVGPVSPVATNSTSEGKTANRRVEVVLK